MTVSEGTSIIALHGAAGGQGTTVCTAALAHHLASAGKTVLLVDYRGDMAATVGLANDPEAPTADDFASIDALRAQVRQVERNLHLLAYPFAFDRHRLYGNAPFIKSDIDRLLACAVCRFDFIVIDAGSLGLDESRATLSLLPKSAQHLLVCAGAYTPLRRYVHADVGDYFAGVIVYQDAERPLRAREVADVVQLPVLAKVDRRAEIARAHDAGVLMTRIPAGLMEDLADLMISRHEGAKA